uniref:Uncharacterized protein n=1 Tax=Oryza barthii TaxID=65489 RepID=A0A0D3H188_9ORYZ
MDGHGGGGGKLTRTPSSLLRSPTGAAVPSPAYEVTTTTSLSSVLAASAYSVLRSTSMGAAVVRLDAYEDDGGDDGKKKAVAAARGGGDRRLDVARRWQGED